MRRLVIRRVWQSQQRKIHQNTQKRNGDIENKKSMKRKKRKNKNQWMKNKVKRSRGSRPIFFWGLIVHKCRKRYLMQGWSDFRRTLDHWWFRGKKSEVKVVERVMLQELQSVGESKKGNCDDETGQKERRKTVKSHSRRDGMVGKNELVEMAT